MKKHESCTPIQPSTSNSSAEVFVLPPELLAKLGISLNNIENSEIPPSTSTSSVKDTVQSVNHSIANCLLENEDTSSIIQTANLMKESVFLSPTFLQTPPIAPNNDEPIVIDESIVNTNSSIISECATSSHQCNRNSVSVTEINSFGKHIVSEVLNKSILIKPNTELPTEEMISIEDLESVKEYQVENHDGDLILTDVLYQSVGKDKASNYKSSTIIVDEHPDEAYLSDCSNSYSGCSPKSINSEVSKQNLPHKNKSKEISKAVASDTLQLKNKEETNVKYIMSNSIFTPVNTNSKVTLCEVENNSIESVTYKQPTTTAKIKSIVAEHTVQAESFVTTEKLPSKKIISCLPDKQQGIEMKNNNLSEKIASNVFLNDNKESDDTTVELLDSETSSQGNAKSAMIVDKQDLEKLSQESIELPKISEVTYKSIETYYSSDKKTFDCMKTKDSEKKHSVTESTQDKVKEIALYLSQIANDRKKNKNNNNRNTEKEPKGDPITSKLCVQGVEKPGGKLIQKDILECLSVEKTYQRSIIRKQIPTQIEISDAVLTTDSFQIIDNTRDTLLNRGKSRSLTHKHEFCKCYDFGNLAYYDCEMLYEHIHFKSHKNIECDLETLYSIYHEASTMCKQTVDFVEDANQIEYDGNTITQNTLCWNEINLPINNEKIDADYSNRQQPMMNEKMNTGTIFEPSTSAKSTKKCIKKRDLKSCNTAIKTNDEDKHVFGNVPNASVSCITAPKSLKKPVDEVEVEFSKNTPKSENIVSSISAQTPLTLKKHSNDVEIKSIKSVKQTKKNLSTESNTGNLCMKSNKTHLYGKELTRPADITTNTNNETLKITSKLSKTKNDFGSTQEIFNKGNTLEVSKDIDISTYIKSEHKTSDEDTNTVSKLLKSMNKKKQQEINNRTTKRFSNTAQAYPSVKRIKTTESPTVSKIVDDEPKKHPTTIKVVHPKHAKVLEVPIIPSKVEIIDSTDQDGTVEIMINPSSPNRSMNNNIMEDSTITYDSMNTTVEDSTVPDESVTTAMESSIMSSDSVINDSQTTEYYMVIAPVPISNNNIKCAKCDKSVEETQWIEHISNEHQYLAWREGEDPLDLTDEISIKKHLQNISNRWGGLKCSKCGLVRKFAKKYLHHIKNCNGERMYDSQEQEEDHITLLDLKSRKCLEKSIPSQYTCGVCYEIVEQSSWIQHIHLKHKYLAWTSEEQPLDLNNANEVKQHLNYISKHHGGLVCNICSVKWNYVKKYLKHIQECETGSVTKIVQRKVSKEKSKLVLPPIVTCGVCKLEVERKHWIKHIQVAHQYVAWIGGEDPLDPNDEEQMKGHLDMIVDVAGELVCMNCGETRKHTRGYLQHIAACAKTGFQVKIDEPDKKNTNEFVCGVCRECGKLSDWTSHAMSMHYNIAWKVGEVPINLKNPYAVERYLKIYRKKHGLVCLNCRQSRSSCCGFYAHILTCGKSEEEIAEFHEECEICQNKYLCIYRNQHMAAHRDSEQRREKREMQARKAEEDARKPPESAEPTGKRKAAEKAKKVIQKHSSNTVDGMPVCGCGATFKDAEEFSQHNCPQKQTNDEDGSDASVKLENESGESADEIIDSGVSDEEDERSEKKKKRIRVGEGSTKVQRMPYRVNNYTAYLSEAYKDFVKLHFTTERLFNEWRNSEYQIVSVEDTAKYLPQVTESCKVRFGSKLGEEWITYKRFEAKKIRGYSIFTGGAIQCIAWAPPNPDDETLSNYLAVSTHRGPDVPRYSAADLPQYPASLQLWDFGLFNAMPRCGLCLAHEYGVVWAMDWCPSGARDVSNLIVPHYSEEPDTIFRLGLLAIACSNGSAYILAVPCPPPGQDQQDPVMYKLKPTAELRLSMTSERRVYQATSIKWSPQKDHSVIIVGYSDGTTALYDLNTESPFLTSTEKGVTIFYPFQDRQTESTSVTGVGVCVTRNESYPIGGQFSTSMSGGTMCAGTRPAARVHVAISGAVHAAHWPAVMLCGDAPFMRSVSEMEWWGGGRRAGAGRAWAACARCARAACASSPALRVHRHHPAYPDIKKVIVALLLMIPIGQKKKRKVNDDFSVVVEPLTYDDAVAKYGLQLTFVTKSSKSEQVQAQQICNEHDSRPERFPLSDIVALEFCPSSRFHDKVAMATHTGLIFIINT